MKTFTSYSDETSLKHFKVYTKLKINEKITIAGSFYIKDYDKLAAHTQAKKLIENFDYETELAEIEEIKQEESYDNLEIGSTISYNAFSVDDEPAINHGIVRRKHNKLGDYVEIQITNAADNSIKQEGETDIINYELIKK